EYQRSLLSSRFLADLTDMGIVAGVYLLFVAVTYFQMPESATVDRRIVGVYIAGFLLLLGIYFLLFMLSASQTPGMKMRQLEAVSREGEPLEPRNACLRGFGYFISIVPLMLGFVWALIDPEHLTWADKVSGTYLKKL
ncbi:MAG TPA: RDD family protein, partial [Terriglobia bacterium]|nr:RDD family protein [Terriglobia bacterium]